MDLSSLPAALASAPKALAALIRSHPLLALAASNAAVAVYVASEGRPLRFLYKHLFRAALAAVPASIVAAEEAKLRDKIEHSVIGSSLDGEQRFTALPAEGLPKADVLAMLERYSGKDKEKWNSKKVRQRWRAAHARAAQPRALTTRPPSPPRRSLAPCTTAART